MRVVRTSNEARTSRIVAGLALLVGLGSFEARARAAAVDPLDVQGLELADGSIVDPPRRPAWGQAPADPRTAERRLAALRRELGTAWITWDDAREAPAGIITSGTPAPGAVSSAAAAEALARAWLARHHELLAPGSELSDFVLAGNEVSSGIRSVGFVQHFDGIPVVGGQVSLHFEHDSLVHVASTTLPHVHLSRATGALDPAAASERAREWIADDFAPAVLGTSGPLGTVVLPVWTGAGWSYREVVMVAAEAEEPLGRWTVYLDARTGAPVAREQALRSAATVRFNVPTRWPGGARTDQVAPELFLSEGGVPTSTNLAGEVTLVNSPTSLTLSVSGARVAMNNSAGAEASMVLPATDGGTVVWSESGNEFGDAQLSAFVHASLVKSFVRTLAPGLAWLDGSIGVTVNIGGSCNAASDGDSIYFLQSDGSCGNTARLADVVYHEVGHSVHRQSLIEGVGAFDSALSEGISDYLAATIVDDSGMGRGFFHSNEPLRELDPPGSEWTWPDDIGEVHATGRIIGGTLWDLRTELMGTMGAAAGQAHVDQLWYESIRRAVDIPSMYPQALLFDDDDGNLANGTPNGCEINAAFEAHGLLDPSALGGTDLELVQVEDGRQVRLLADVPAFPGCPVGLDEVELRWRVRGAPDDVTTVAMVLDGGAWVATIPTHDTGEVVEYQVGTVFTNGFERRLPENPADPWAQTFFGGVETIYCLDDQVDLGEWITAGSGNNWSFGPLTGTVTVDPADPWDADGVLLTQDDEYSAGSNTYAASPVIDVTGYDDVRLHYRRWLTVEDGFFDRATVYANSQPVWQNLETEIHSVHHIDHRWRFHDLPLNDFVADDAVQIAFGLTSDGGLEFGGWTVDGMCVVQVVDEVCGDNWVSGTEECDDGNTEDGDGCDSTCMLEEGPGPGTTDDGGTEDTGPADGTSGGSSGVDGTGGPVPPGGTGSGPDGTGTGMGDTEGDPGQEGGGEGCGCVAAGSGRGRVGWGLLLPLMLLGLRRRR